MITQVNKALCLLGVWFFSLCAAKTNSDAAALCAVANAIMFAAYVVRGK